MSRSRMTNADRAEVASFIGRHWHSKVVMSRGRKFYPHQEEGFLERRNSEIIGLLTYSTRAEELEILTLNATIEGEGIGTSLMLNAIGMARACDCSRIVLTTTNDRLRAIGFYQRLGFRMVAVNVGVVDEARKTKPEIPETGENGIPIHDEIVMELELQPSVGRED